MESGLCSFLSLFADEQGRAQLEALRDTLEKMAAQAGASMAEEKARAPPLVLSGHAASLTPY